MSQQSYNHNLEGALESLQEITRYKSLLEMAIENTAIFSEENFNRVTVLLQSFSTLLNSELDDLDTHLRTLRVDNDNDNSVSHVNNTIFHNPKTNLLEDYSGV
jgi:hypothetical protein